MKPTPPASPKDVSSVKAVVTALYEGISFRPGGEPEWDRIRSLFIPGGRLIPPRVEASGDYPVLDVEGFIAWANQFAHTNGLRAKGFYEKEIHGVTETFGNVAHVFSTYETRFTAEDPEPFERGINSIQIVRDRERWWAVTIFWDIESPDEPIPPRYLPGGEKSTRSRAG